MLQIHVNEHPLLDAAGVGIELPGPQGEESPSWLQEMISRDFPCEPMTEELRKAVRSLLRHGGYRPAGRAN